MNQIRKRLTYANVMSSIAVFLVLGGATALAASHLGKNSVGSKQLKKNSVTAAKIKKNAVTGAKIKNGSVASSKLKGGAVTAAQLGAGAVTNEKLAGGSVTGDKIANGAVGAAQLGANSVGNGQTQQVKVFKGGAVPAVGEEESSPRIELGSVGPFRFYGKCYTEGGEVTEKTYIELTSGTAVLGSEDAANFHNNGEGYLTPATPENERALEDEAVAEADAFNAESSDEEFQASASDGTEITGEAAGTGAKQGNPPAGNGPFLAGDSCIIGSIAVFGS